MLVVLLAVSVLALPAVWADEDDAKLTADERALFDWWDRLGFPDVRRLRFVRVASANWIQWGNEPKKTIYDHAFLLDSDAERFTVFTSDLRILRLEKTRPDVQETERVGFDPADLPAFAQSGLETYARPAKRPLWVDAPDPFLMHRWSIPDQSFRALVLARACAARGHEALAHRLCQLALKHHTEWPRPKEPPADRFAGLKRALADEAHAALVERVSDAGWSHAELAAAFRRFAQAFPSHAKAAHAGLTTKTLSTWIGKADSTPKHDLARRVERAQRAPCEWWGGMFYEEGNKALRHHQALITFEAVPRLLRLIGSPAPTRTVIVYWSGKGQYRDGRVRATLGDVATLLLREIAAGALAQEYRNRPSTPEARVAKFRERATRWWSEVQSRGEAEVLAARVTAGKEGALRAARRLLDLNPARGIATLVAALRTTGKPYPAAQLVELLGTRPEDGATRALVGILNDQRTGPRLRLEAAKALHARGHRGAVPAMLSEWLDPSPQPVQEDVGLPADPGFAGDLLEFLTQSRDVRAYRALAERLDALPAYWRFQVAADFLTKRGDRADSKVTAATLPPEVARVLEDLLASRLTDKGEVEGVHMAVGGVDVDPRIGHVAARALAVQFPTHYRYDGRASSRLRERMRLVALNVWRVRRGKKPLELPQEPPPPERVPAAQVLPLVVRIEAATTDDERTETSAALVRLGVGAIPALLEAAEAALDAKQHKARATLASRQASIVTSVEVTEDSAKPDAELLAMLERMRGRPLDGATYVALMLHATNALPDGAEGLRVRAARSDDLRGMAVRVTVVARRHDDGMNGGGWSFGTPGGGYGTCALDYGKTAAAWKDSGDDLDYELSSDARRELVVRFFVVREVDR